MLRCRVSAVPRESYFNIMCLSQLYLSGVQKSQVFHQAIIDSVRIMSIIASVIVQRPSDIYYPLGFSAIPAIIIISLRASFISGFSFFLRTGRVGSSWSSWGEAPNAGRTNQGYSIVLFSWRDYDWARSASFRVAPYSDVISHKRERNWISLSAAYSRRYRA